MELLEQNWRLTCGLSPQKNSAGCGPGYGPRQPSRTQSRTTPNRSRCRLSQPSRTLRPPGTKTHCGSDRGLDQQTAQLKGKSSLNSMNTGLTLVDKRSPGRLALRIPLPERVPSVTAVEPDIGGSRSLTDVPSGATEHKARGPAAQDEHLKSETFRVSGSF
jgi:hypothetical protein